MRNHHLKNTAARPKQTASTPAGEVTSIFTCDDPLLVAKESAAEVGLSLPAFWRGVRAGRFPAPFYPAPRAPRWRRSELRAALEALRQMPAEAVAARRSVRHARPNAT
jgi:predicted DNA-binding transcriptional regulator AlpA